MKWLRGLVSGCWLAAASSGAVAATTNIYFTQFEPGEGYNRNLDLIGQSGWQGAGSGGNGLISNAIPGLGQQAYLGYAAPFKTNSSLVVWRPLNFQPNAAGFPLVKFSVRWKIVDSQFGYRDIFRWSVYNRATHRLFSVDLDNEYLDVSYLLDGTNQVVLTPVRFNNTTNYTLNVTMNFAANRWSATLNQTLIATNQPLTTTGATLDLGDIAAVWLIHQINNTNAPGDNYLVFDDYRVTAETLPVPTATVQLLGRTPSGWSLLRVTGTADTRWALEGSTNLSHWTALQTNQITDSSFDVVDQSAVGLPRRYYRARFVP